MVNPAGGLAEQYAAKTCLESLLFAFKEHKGGWW
jgi:hypothetical protein